MLCHQATEKSGKRGGACMKRPKKNEELNAQNNSESFGSTQNASC